MDAAADRAGRPGAALLSRASTRERRAADPARRPAAAWPVAAAFAIAFVLYRNAVLNNFYDFGAGTDPLWFSGILWRGNWLLTGAVGIDDRTFLGTHFSPILLVPALLSHLLSFDHVAWFAIVIAFFHALATASFAWVCRQAARRRIATAWAADLLAFGLGLGFAVCALQAAFMGLPHYEIAIPAFLIAMLGALALGHRTAAAFFFAALLATREDAGFHAATFLAPLVVFLRWRERRWLRPETAFLAIGLAYSLAVMLAMPHVFPEGVNFFRSNYVGDPPFAHLTLANLAQRFDFLFWQAGRIWIPLALLAAYAAVRRDLIMAVGAIAVVPWIVLHAVFVRHETGATLSYYYPFPVLVSLAWPAIAALYRHGPAAIQGAARNWAWLQVAVVVFAFTPALHTRLPFSGSIYQNLRFTSSEAALNAEVYRAFKRALESGRPELGRLGANLEAVALSPHVLKRSEWIDSLGPGVSVDAERLDTILLFDRYWPCPEANAVVARARLPNVFQVPGTRIVVLTRRSLGELLSFWTLLAPHPKPNGPFCGRKTLR